MYTYSSNSLFYPSVQYYTALIYHKFSSSVLIQLSTIFLPKVPSNPLAHVDFHIRHLLHTQARAMCNIGPIYIFVGNHNSLKVGTVP